MKESAGFKAFSLKLFDSYEQTKKVEKTEKEEEKVAANARVLGEADEKIVKKSKKKGDKKDSPLKGVHGRS